MSEEEPKPVDPPNDPAQGAEWDELFSGMKPAEVKEALENSRKWESRSKANKTALDELTTKFETSESEKSTLAEKVNEYESKEQRTKLVTDVAKEQEVPADALRGTTREELEAHAQVLKSLLKPIGPTIPGQEQLPDRPAEDPMRELARGLFADKD